MPDVSELISTFAANLGSVVNNRINHGLAGKSSFQFRLHRAHCSPLLDSHFVRSAAWQGQDFRSITGSYLHIVCRHPDGTFRFQRKSANNQFCSGLRTYPLCVLHRTSGGSIVFLKLQERRYFNEYHVHRDDIAQHYGDGRSMALPFR